MTILAERENYEPNRSALARSGQRLLPWLKEETTIQANKARKKTPHSAESGVFVLFCPDGETEKTKHSIRQPGCPAQDPWLCVARLLWFCLGEIPIYLIKFTQLSRDSTLALLFFQKPVNIL
jgi:hypothetical protein